MAGTPPGCDRPLASAKRGDASRTNRTYVYLTCPWNVYSDHGAGAKCLILLGAPEGIRTSDLCLRRATLYPAELRALRAIQYLIDGPGATGAGRKPAGAQMCHWGCLGVDARAAASTGSVGGSRRLHPRRDPNP